MSCIIFCFCDSCLVLYSVFVIHVLYYNLYSVFVIHVLYYIISKPCIIPQDTEYLGHNFGEGVYRIDVGDITTVKNSVYTYIHENIYAKTNLRRLKNYECG